MTRLRLVSGGTARLRLAGARGPAGGVGPEGPQGPTGEQGPQGLPGVNAVPADDAVATYASTEGTATRTALNTAFAGLPDGAIDTDEALNIYFRGPTDTAGWTTSNEVIARALGWAVITDKRYAGGAVPGTSFDSQPAIMAAYNAALASASRTLYIPGKGTSSADMFHVMSPLVWDTGLIVRGANRETSRIRSATGDVLHLSGSNHNFYGVTFQAGGSAGNVVSTLPSGERDPLDATKFLGIRLDQAVFEKCHFLQNNPAKHIWYFNQPTNDDGVTVTDSGLFDNHWIDCRFSHLTNGTVNPFWTSGGHSFSGNRFTRCRAYLSGRQFFHHESRVSGSYLYTNVWDTFNFERCNGGIRLYSAINNNVRAFGFFDNNVAPPGPPGPADINYHMVEFDRLSPAHSPSRGNTVIGYQRTVGNLVGGACDIKLGSGGAVETTLVGVGGPPSATITVDLGGNRATVIGSEIDVLSNDSQAIVISDSAVRIGGTVIAPPLFAAKSADTTINNSTTVVDDPHLTVTVAANSVYQIEGLLLVDSSNTADFKGSWTVPSGATFSFTMDGLVATGTTTTGQVSRMVSTSASLAVVGAGAGTPVAARPVGLLRTGANPGAVTFKWAQSTAEATDTKLLTNSWIKLTKVG